MKKLLTGCMVSVVLGMAIHAVAQNQSQDSSSSQSSGQSASGQPGIAVSEKATIEATVEKVDKKKHEVTFKGAEGDKVKVQYDEQKNPIMAQLSKGDEVTLNFMRSAAVRLAKPGEEPTGREEESFVLVPEKGSTPDPSAIAVKTIKTTATVEAIDAKTRQVTLKDAEGDTVKLKVDERVQNLDKIKKGDQIVATYTEGVSVSVEKKK
jgi:Cu/Ag efflux protein CusF